jgi:transcriptional regulator with XRE-family HTH domain
MVYTKVMTNEELKKWRRRNGYSQAKLAKALGVAVMTVSRWETGLRSIPVFLNLALNWLEYEGGKATGRKERKEVKRHGKHL